MTPDRHDPAAYGAAIADDYDTIYEQALDTEGAIAFLAAIAGEGPVLELGIGTGRLALPLAQAGLEVHGMDSSPQMLDKLRAKAGAERVRASLGDFAKDRVDAEFTLVVLAFNTIFAMPDQDGQVAVFENAARHLRSGGRFVVEAFVPDLARFRDGSAISLRHLGDTHVALDVARLDRAEQRMQTTQLRAGPDGVRCYPANHRYAWPAELDLMARIAGLARSQRYADWRHTPFTGASAAHVSVYSKR